MMVSDKSASDRHSDTSDCHILTSLSSVDAVEMISALT